MVDSYGDGWNGNVMTIGDDTYTLETGSESTVIVGVCENVEILGCTDETACNYDAAANTDDGSCTYPYADFLDCTGGFLGCSGDDVFMQINASDSFGDGWNGNLMSLYVDGVLFDPPSFGYTYTLAYSAGATDLSYDEVPFCVSPDATCFEVTVDGGSWQSEVSWEIVDADGVAAISGGAPFSGSFGDCSAFGCTDAGACNFDEGATNDNGSCDYSCLGCTDPAAANYDETATIDDGSCVVSCTDVAIVCDGGSWQSEVSWSIFCLLYTSPSPRDRG